MKTILHAKRMYIASSGLLCLTGAAMLLWPGMSLKVICGVVGALMLVFAAGKLVGYFSKDPYGLAFQFDLALGVVIAVVGVVLLLYPGNVLSILSVLIGLFVLIDGAFKLQTSLDARRFGMRGWWLILVGAVLSALAAAVLIFYPGESANVLTSLAGASLLIDGGQNLFSSLYTVRGMKNLHKERLVSVLEDVNDID